MAKKGEYQAQYEEVMSKRHWLNLEHEEWLLDCEKQSKKEHEYKMRLLHAYRKRIDYIFKPLIGHSVLLYLNPSMIHFVRELFEYSVEPLKNGGELYRAQTNLRADSVVLNQNTEFALDYTVERIDSRIITLQGCDLSLRSCPEHALDTQWNDPGYFPFITELSNVQLETAHTLLGVGVFQDPPFIELRNWLANEFDLPKPAPLEVEVKEYLTDEG